MTPPLPCPTVSAPNEISPGVALSEFGKRPYRYHPAAKKDDEEEDSWDLNWHDYHSMHTPDEVRQMIKELGAAAPTIEKSRNKGAINDYDSLMPVLEQLAEEGRMLFVQTDTNHASLPCPFASRTYGAVWPRPGNTSIPPFGHTTEHLTLNPAQGIAKCKFANCKLAQAEIARCLNPESRRAEKP